MDSVDSQFYNNELLKNLFGSSILINMNLAVSCPHCGVKVRQEVIFRLSEYDHFTETGATYVFSRCPDCKDKMFLIYDLFKDYSYDEGEERAAIFAGAPKMFPSSQEEIEYGPENIEKVSPSFIKIYKQALQAEKLGLDELCGAGFRVAVEFLVKDYLIYMGLKKEEEVIKLRFADCIDLLKEGMKKFATASNWLACDYIHYRKRHEEYGVADLKDFIDFLVLKVQSAVKEKLAEEKFEDMKEKRKINK